MEGWREETILSFDRCELGDRKVKRTWRSVIARREQAIKTSIC